MVPVAGEVQEPLVAPDDVVGVGPEEDDGQRGGEHGPAGGGIDAARDAVEVAQDLLLAFGDARAQIEVEQQHGRDLAQAQGGVEQAGEHGEDEAQREEGAEAGVGEPGQDLLEGLRTQGGTSFGRRGGRRGWPVRAGPEWP